MPGSFFFVEQSFLLLVKFGKASSVYSLCNGIANDTSKNN